MRITKLLFVFSLVAYTCLVGAEEYSSCGSLDNPYGPYDYTNPLDKKFKLPVVDGHHFDSDVENLIHGQSGSIIADLDFTLRAFPNHHRALNTVARYQLSGGDMKGFYSAECYFERALRFKPNDGVVYLIQGNFYYKKGDFKSALQSYKKALEIMPSSAEVNYNLGLLFVKLGKYSKARKFAIQAYKRRYPMAGLKEQLEKSGHWSIDDEKIISTP